MRFATRMVSILAILLMVSACAATFTTDPERYNLDDQLERVMAIDNFAMVGWNGVDTQSFVLQTRSSGFYLVVLNVPSYELSFAENIVVNTSGSLVRAGSSTVVVKGENTNNSFVIDKLYKFRDAGEIQPIIDQIRGHK